MTEADNISIEKRVVITIDSGSFSDTTIEYAVTIAARLKRPLHGVFIEDTDLASSASLPFTTEICFTTGQPRQFDSGSLEAALGTVAKRFQQRLAQRAEQMAVRWSVSSIRGRRRDFNFEHIAAADYCIYEAERPVRKSTRLTHKIKQLLVIDGYGPEFYQTLAALLAPLEGNEVDITLMQSAPDKPIPETTSLLPAGVHIHPIAKAQLVAILQQGDNTFDYVVISRQHWPLELVPALARLSCPLIVVG